MKKQKEILNQLIEQLNKLSPSQTAADEIMRIAVKINIDYFLKNYELDSKGQLLGMLQTRTDGFLQKMINDIKDEDI